MTVEGEVILSKHSSSTGYIWLVALIGTTLLGSFIIAWHTIPVFWVALPPYTRATRAALTDKALYSLGGRITYEEILGVEGGGTGILKVRGYGSVYRLTGNKLPKDGRHVGNGRQRCPDEPDAE